MLFYIYGTKHQSIPFHHPTTSPLPASSQRLAPSQNPVPSANWIKLLFPPIGFGLLALAVFVGIQIGKNQSSIEQPAVTQSSISLAPTVTPINPVPAISQSSGWKTAKFGSLFSYEYPASWNVAELWQDNYAELGTLIAIDPNPINTAPRGGPIAALQMTILNGNKNPDDILAKKIAGFNQDSYSDITQEIINADFGKIYHFKGKISGEMLKGQPVEKYFFTFNQNPSDPINQQVVTASLELNDDPKLSAMLRHIVMSIKKLTP